MSKKIDEKVVEMQFDNKNFEKNVSTTMSTLDKLKQKLKFDGASKGFENIQNSANKVNLNPIGSAVETIGVKFNSLYTIADQALRNITNSAMQAGKQIVSAFTIDPIKTGFQEYETQINAVQTILANTQSKGSTLTDVNAALDELNKYADQTIYNFTEMTRNIGTFTAAGVDLDKSVTSIKGIANLAAVSGSNATQASTAMYQLSQALAAGKVSLMDWNSVVNAGMGGQVFQDALKRTAENFGYNVDGMIKKYGSFRESLTEGGWLTAEVLTETLTQLSGAYSEADLIAQGYSEQQAKEITELAQTAVDAATKVKTFTQLFDTLKEAAQSGWTQTWEIMVGDFEEAKDFLTELSETFGEIINQSAEARNALLYDAMTSNWKKITDGITEAGISAEDFKDKVSEIAKANGVDVDRMIEEYGSLEAAFKNGAISSEYLNKALISMTGTTDEIKKKMKDLGLGLEDNADSVKKLTDAGLEQADAQELVKKSIDEQVKALNELSDEQLLSIGYTTDQVAAIRELPKQLDLANGSLKEFIDNVSVQKGREMLLDAIRVSLRSLIDICGAVGKAWRDVFPPTTSDQLLNVVKGIKDFALAMRPTEETLDKITRTFRGFFSLLDIGRQAIVALLSPIGDLFGDFKHLGGGILDLTANFGDWLTSLNEGIKAGNTFSTVSETISKALKWVMDGINSVIDGLGGFTGSLTSFGNIVKNVFNGILNVVKNVISWISDNISMGDIFAGLAGGGIFALAKKLGEFVDKLKDIFNFGGSDGPGLKDTFVEVLGSVHDSLESFQQGIQVASLVGIAIAVSTLVSALKKISEIEPAKIAYSLLTIELLIKSLNKGFTSLTKTLNSFNVKGTIKSAVTIMALAKAVDILAGAMVKLSDLSLEEVVKGLIAVGGAIIELSAGMRILNGASVNLRTSVALLALAKAVDILSESLVLFSAMSWEEIARGLTAMGGALLELSGSLALLSKVGGGGALLGSIGVLIASFALDEIAENLQKMGLMSWEEIGKGLSAMGGALLEFTVCLSILSEVGGFGAILGGASILIAVQSLEPITAALERISKLSWEEIAKGLTGMGVALVELTACLSILSEVGGFGAILGGVGILITVQSLEPITTALERISKLSWEEIAKGLTGMGVALVELTACLSILSEVGGFGAILGGAAILITVQALEPIAETLERLSKLTWEEIAKGLTAMGVALVEVAGVSGALGKLAGLSGLFGAGAIYIATQGLVDLGIALNLMGGMSWEEIKRGLTAMGLALVEIATISGVLGWVAPIAGLVGAGSLYLAIQGLNDLAEALKKFGSMSWDEIGRGLTAMGAAMGEVALGGILNTFSGFGAVNIGKIVEPLSALADSVKKWTTVTVPENLSEQLKILAEGVNAFMFAGWGADAVATVAVPLGYLADSVRKWYGVTVPDNIGDNLLGLATGVNYFMFAGWGSDAIATVAEPLGSLADSVKKWYGVTVPSNIGEELSDLADGVGEFIFAGWGADGLTKAAPGVADMADAVAKWNGVTIPDDLGSGLTSIADGIKSFNWAFVGTWTIDMLVEPLKNLVGSVTAWEGVTVPEGIDDGLTRLSDGVKAFNWAFIGGLTIGSIVEPLTNLADAVKAWDGIDISGLGPQLETFAAGLKAVKDAGVNKSLGTNISKFFEAFSNENVSLATTNIQSSATALQSMASVDVDQITALGTALTSIASIGITELVSEFQNGAVQLQTSVTTITTTLTTFLTNTASVAGTSSIAIGNAIGNGILNGMKPGLSSVPSTVTATISLAVSAIQSQVSLFQSAGLAVGTAVGVGFQSSASSTNMIVTNILNGMLTIITNKMTTFKTAGSNLISNFISGARSKQSEAVSTVKTIVTSIETMVTGYYSTFETMGKTLMSNMVSGASSKSGDFTKVFDSAISSAKTSISGYYNDFTSLGGYLAQGFAAGIDANSGLIAEKAASAARKAYNSAMNTLDAHSPSRLFMKVGGYLAQGFAIGIENSTGQVETASVSMADAAITKTKDAIAMLSDAIKNGIDSQPTIRPVLDLSAVEEGANSLNTMFSRNRALSVSSSIASARAGAAGIQNGTETSAPVTTNQFIQNNYSPKALSNIEIYRQTKNLFSAMERKVTG